jgi:hypothetical protein
MTTILWLGASVAIGYFGLRYLMKGLKGGGVKLYEQAVEADFFKGPSVVPRRRTVPLLKVHISGSERLATARAITTTGHAFRLPPTLVEEADLWYLGSLGAKPLAPGGREAKERFEKGELRPYEEERPEPLADPGPAWPDPGTFPITVDVPIEEEGPEKVEPPTPAAPPIRPPARAPPMIEPVDRPEPSPPVQVMPAPVTPSPVTPSPVSPPEAVEIPPRPLDGPVDDIEELPEATPPEERARITLPPPPRVRPPPTSVPKAPEHRPVTPEPPPEMTPEPEPEPVVPSTPPTAVAPPAPPAPPAPSSDEWELEEMAPPPEPTPPPAATVPPGSSSEWELEELPPQKKVEKKRPAPSSGSEWEEL